MKCSLYIYFIFRANFDRDVFTHAHVAIEHAHVSAAQVDRFSNLNFR